MITIHGKQYVTVAERVDAVHKDQEHVSITTELIPSDKAVIVKATVTTQKGVFTGMSAANPNKPIEKMTPYEVAETSAVGRALGFAGYGIVDGIATADEVTKANDSDPEWIKDFDTPKTDNTCPLHGAELKVRFGGVKDHRAKGIMKGTDLVNTPNGEWYCCNGTGWKLSNVESK